MGRVIDLGIVTKVPILRPDPGNDYRAVKTTKRSQNCRSVVQQPTAFSNAEVDKPGNIRPWAVEESERQQVIRETQAGPAKSSLEELSRVNSAYFYEEIKNQVYRDAFYSGDFRYI